MLIIILTMFSCVNNNQRNTIYLPYVISEKPDPLNILYSGDWILTTHLWKTLIDIDDRGQVVPVLAEKWHSSADGLEWYFKLNDTSTWSNGKNITLDETLNSLKTSLKGTSHSGLSKEVSNISTKDGMIVFTLKYAIPHFLTILSYPDWAIFHPDSIKVKNNKFTVNSTIVSGDFKIVENESSGPVDEIVLINKNKKKKKIFKIYQNCSEIHDLSKVVSFRMYNDVMTQECLMNFKNKGFEIIKAPPSWVLKADFTKRAILNIDIQKRQKITSIIVNKLKTDYQKLGTYRATGLRAPTLYGSLTLPEFDKKNNKLIKDLENIQIESLHLDIVVMNEWKDWKAYKWLINVLKINKIILNETVLSKSEFFKEFGNTNLQKNYDLVFIPLGVGDSDPDGTWRIATKYFYSSIFEESELIKAYIEIDRSKREKLYKNLSLKLIDQAAYIPLVMQSDYIGIHKSASIKKGYSLRLGISFSDVVE